MGMSGKDQSEKDMAAQVVSGNAEAMDGVEQSGEGGTASTSTSMTRVATGGTGGTQESAIGGSAGVEKGAEGSEALDSPDSGDGSDKGDGRENERKKVWRAGLLGQLKKLLTWYVVLLPFSLIISYL